MSQSLIVDLFLYFAKFPTRSGVLSLFQKGISSMDGYNQLYSQIANLPEGLMPKIEHYVFGPNIDALKVRIDSLAGYYLMVDYGEIASQKSTMNQRREALSTAITVAYKLDNFSSDLIDQAIVSDAALQMIVDIRNTLKQDQRERPSLRYLSDDHSFAPFIARELSSVGWTLLTSRDQMDTFPL